MFFHPSICFYVYVKKEQKKIFSIYFPLLNKIFCRIQFMLPQHATNSEKLLT